jgi:hypothetical protein
VACWLAAKAGVAPDEALKLAAEVAAQARDSTAETPGAASAPRGDDA